MSTLQDQIDPSNFISTSTIHLVIPKEPVIKPQAHPVDSIPLLELCPVDILPYDRAMLLSFRSMRNKSFELSR